jgi:hypothetical protein
MRLGEADKLLKPYLNNPAFDEFEKQTPRLLDLTAQITEKIQNLNTNHFLGQAFVEVDEETSCMFLEFAEICKKSLAQFEAEFLVRCHLCGNLLAGDEGVQDDQGNWRCETYCIKG